jgi:hypothetical protein
MNNWRQFDNARRSYSVLDAHIGHCANGDQGFKPDTNHFLTTLSLGQCSIEMETSTSERRVEDPVGKSFCTGLRHCFGKESLWMF